MPSITALNVSDIMILVRNDRSIRPGSSRLFPLPPQSQKTPKPALPHRDA
jgi:hypothetical protein